MLRLVGRKVFRSRSVRLAPAIGLALLLGAVGSAGAQEGPCAEATRLLEAGFLERARAVLVPEEAATPTPDCVSEVAEALAEAYRSRAAAFLAVDAAEEAHASHVAALELRPEAAGDVTRQLVERYRSLGDGLLAAGEIEAAKSAYISAIELRPELAPELNGELVEAYLERGRALRQAGATEEARAAFVAAANLTAEAGGEPASAPDPFAAVRELASLGEISTARTQLETLISESPGLAVPPDLRYLHGGAWEWWRSFRGEVQHLLPTLVEVGVALLVILLVLFLGPRLVHSAIGLFERKLVFGEFQSGGAQTPDGASFAAAVQGKILELARANPDRRIAIVTAASEAVEIPEVVGQASTASQGLSAVLNQLIKRLPLAPYSVTAALHDPGRRGPGVTLHFLRGKSVLATTTLWQSPYTLPGQVDLEGEKASYYELAELTAVWTLFQLKGHSRRRWQRPFRLLGTGNWKAFALFQAGVRAFELRDEERAAYCFERAMLLDRNFYAARFNLARTHYTSDRGQAKKQIAQGLSQLTAGQVTEEDRDEIAWRTVWDRLEQTAGSAPLDEPVGKGARLAGYLADPWYFRARYSLVGLLVGDFVARWRTNKGGRLGTDTEGLRCRLLGQVERFSVDLLLAAQTLGPASAWRLRSRVRHGGREREDELRTIVAGMARALEPVVAALELLLTDDGKRRPADETELKPRWQALERRAEEGSALFCYNWACLLSLDSERLGQDSGAAVEQAVVSLKRAITHEPFREGQIDTDPLLVHLSATAEFRSVFGGAAAPPAVAGAADLELVGEELGQALAERGVDSFEKLLLATARQSHRRRLAFELGISRALALRWAHLAELCRVGGIEAPALNLLERAGAGSLALLADCDPVELAEHLASLGRILGQEVAIPNPDLAAWIAAAQALLPTMVEGGPRASARAHRSRWRLTDLLKPVSVRPRRVR